ncbi:hypothetical protein M0R45_015002 [Rubus argutus]|uniref:Uncharacterized protein n=1 Tax=Rubus argutus TaxID=59490 RepID=A0AAW1XQR6_RUBAR
MGILALKQKEAELLVFVIMLERSYMTQVASWKRQDSLSSVSIQLLSSCNAINASDSANQVLVSSSRANYLN